MCYISQQTFLEAVLPSIVETGLTESEEINLMPPNQNFNILGYTELEDSSIKLIAESEILYAELKGGNKEYVKIQQGGKRLVRYGYRDGRYYIKGGKRTYI